MSKETPGQIILQTLSGSVLLHPSDETIESGTLSAETWALCRRELGSLNACVELVTAIATWRLISQVARSLEIPVEEGVASWPPDGVAPAGAGET